MNSNRPQRLPKQYVMTPKTRTPKQIADRKKAPNRVKRTEERAKARQAVIDAQKAEVAKVEAAAATGDAVKTE